MNLLLRSPTGQQAEHPLEPGTYRLGGGEGDAPRLAGAPAAALELDVAEQWAVATVCAGEISVGARTYAAGERRLLRAREICRAFGHELAIGDSSRPRDGTLGMALGVLAGALQRAPRLPVPSLVWLTGKDCGKRLPLLDEAVYLGRGAGSAARVRDAQASRRHAKLVLRNGEARLVDLGSVNGLRVDGEPVASERRLFGGEVIRIGDTELGFEGQLERPAAPTAAPQVPTATPEPFDSKAPNGGPFPRIEAAMIVAGSLAAVVATVLAWALAR